MPLKIVQMNQMIWEGKFTLLMIDVLPTYKPVTYDEELPGGISSYEWVTSKKGWESLC